MGEKVSGNFAKIPTSTWDRRLYFPFEGRRAEDLFRPKNPTASAGFEPVNLGTKGQHATPMPPKPFHDMYSSSNTIREIKSRRMRWAGHVARMGRVKVRMIL